MLHDGSTPVAWLVEIHLITEQWRGTPAQPGRSVVGEQTGQQFDCQPLRPSTELLGYRANFTVAVGNHQMTNPCGGVAGGLLDYQPTQADTESDAPAQCPDDQAVLLYRGYNCAL